MANVTTARGTLILDTAATIHATGVKVRVRGFIFSGAGPAELQNGAALPQVRIVTTASNSTPIAVTLAEPLEMDGLIVAAGIVGCFTLFTG